MNYPVADFILRIKNAYAARRKVVIMPHSNINTAIGALLVKEGFLATCKTEEVDGKKIISTTLRYVKRRPVVSDVVIISKPSLRTYVDAKHLQKVLQRDAMVAIMSTSQGIMTGKVAQAKNVGGELLFKIW